MKTLLTIVCVLSFALTAFPQQLNPDGNRVSLHFTPFFYYGGVTSENLSSNIEEGLSFQFMIKFPLSKNITVSPFYEKHSFTYITEDSYLADVPDVKHNFNKAGLKFSLYLE